MIMVSLIQHIIYISEWPIPHETANGTSVILDTAQKAANGLLETDRLYKDYTERVVEFVVV